MLVHTAVKNIYIYIYIYICVCVTHLLIQRVRNYLLISSEIKIIFQEIFKTS